jgi:sulfur-oxidizing protein SoxX
MPKPGSRRLRLGFLASLGMGAPGMAALGVALGMAVPVFAQQDPGVHAAEPLVRYRVENDGIATSLTGGPGDPLRGAALFANRQVSTCMLCHADPAAARLPPGTIAPSLADAGSRLTAGQIRLRIVDASRVNPATVMPSFYVIAGLNRVGRQWRDRPILDAAQIEDLVAFLATLRAR